MAIANPPRCIYLDTNILRIVGFTDLAAHFLELKTWADELKAPIAIPKLVWMEWAHDFYENIEKKKIQTKENMRDFRILLGFDSEEFELPGDYVGRLFDTLRGKLKEMGILIIDTPKNISLDELVARATFKIRPFEDKGEKGFRDTIILYTILEDMKNKKIVSSLLVTGDKVFTHKDVSKKIESYKVDIQIATSLEESSKLIKEILDYKARSIIENKEKKLLDFVKSKRSEIFSFVKENAELTEDFITKGGFLSSKQDIFGQIESVVAFEPVEVESAFGRLRSRRDMGYPKNTEPILISVKTTLRVVYSPFLLSRPAVRAPDLSKFKEVVRSTRPRFFGEPTETKLIRNLMVSALAIKNDQGEYSDLKLENASTF
ncbi:MAG: hypothetical protein UT24_C0031G0002 [Candidatus Woesebacteria bacterium GW2011_GWB1_39_12]|uniref:DUF4935 domain-containing protein n=1 Tax=Candidatus Woesebacteria bacterium GW2011_GWB1_39_12 TaxID=1618574 RepID=A0A0G0M6Q6_9BACT|nr:MAG: hypothetical protein UT24_C0031G0002 [Candidatus Woesebacteria bacterium GW2011_GWB1_39_12]